MVSAVFHSPLDASSMNTSTATRANAQRRFTALDFINNSVKTVDLHPPHHAWQVIKKVIVVKKAEACLPIQRNQADRARGSFSGLPYKDV